MNVKKIVPQIYAPISRYNSLPAKLATVFPQMDVSDLKPQLIANSFVTLVISFLIITTALLENSSYIGKNTEVTIYLLYMRIVIIALSGIQFCLLIHY